MQRISIPNGRAARLTWNRGCHEFARGVKVLNRSFRVDLDVRNILPRAMESFSTLSVYIPHLAHGEAWWDSVEDLCSLLSAAPRNNHKYVLVIAM